MSVLILSCACGLRMKARGATPGRVGRCPKCGRTLRVPDPSDAPEVEPIARGYGLTPAPGPLVSPPRTSGLEPERPPPRKKARRRPEVPSRPPEVSRAVEEWWRPDLLFPSRGAEGLMMVASLGLAFWVLTVLVPELCLGFMADAEKLGATLMGVLVSLIAALPSLILGPVAIVYALQYHGRVLVSGAIGEVVPPRPPDRNFDGLSNGLGPWVVWLTCGASIGFGPLACYVFSRGGAEPANALVAFVLAIVGLPYALMSLMMAFIDDRGMPRPIGVVGALMRLNVGFLVVSAIVAALGSALWWTFSGVLSLREGYFWTYLLAMLAPWLLAHWVAIVAMRLLGVFYHHHASTLRWHRKKPWWEVTSGA